MTIDELMEQGKQRLQLADELYEDMVEGEIDDRQATAGEIASLAAIAGAHFQLVQAAVALDSIRMMAQERAEMQQSRGQKLVTPVDLRDLGGI